jgi:decaprenylphospho-beta-D-ribofuranose 2-oxidase
MEYAGWGHYPTIKAKLLSPYTLDALVRDIEEHSSIPRGLGRSYGDSALASTLLSSAHFSHMLAFDENTGQLCVEAGVALKDIIDTFVPRGWFLGVVPGTQYVTIGGAIASDIHGKNHHNAGSFSEFVTSLTLIDAQGVIQTCSRTHNSALFHATCGGMGLTGFIIKATLQLIAIPSAFITQTSRVCQNLDETINAFFECEKSTYSVAWIDSMAQGSAFGRSIILLGEHNEDGDYRPVIKKHKKVPFCTPGFILNKHSIRLFNTLYFQKNIHAKPKLKVPLRDFFFPLDHIDHWNYLYGQSGFLQYQCAFPTKTSKEGIETLLKHLQKNGLSSFLSVLKKMGTANDNLLSFPFEGFSLALDIKNTPQARSVLDECDRILARLGGRLYAAKDARMSAEFFHASYDHSEAFYQFRKTCNAHTRFASLQSTRLEI